MYNLLLEYNVYEKTLAFLFLKACPNRIPVKKGCKKSIISSESDSAWCEWGGQAQNTLNKDASHIKYHWIYEQRDTKSKPGGENFLNMCRAFNYIVQRLGVVCIAAKKIQKIAQRLKSGFNSHVKLRFRCAYHP